MKIVITGTGGFIGGHLKTALEKDGHVVVPYDRKQGKDIRDFDMDINVDMVIHLAADADVRRSIQYPDEYWENNVKPTTKIQRLCHAMNVPLLYASSSCIHNWSLSPYGTSKKVNEETAFPGQVGLRFTTVYGEGARESMLIGKLVRGDIKYLTRHTRDFIHVDDVVKAIQFIMTKVRSPHLFPGIPLEAAYDIGTGKGVVVEEIGLLAGWEGIEVRDGDPCEAQNNTADNSKLRELGWEPTIDIEDYIVRKTIPH